MFGDAFQNGLVVRVILGIVAQMQIVVVAHDDHASTLALLFQEESHSKIGGVLDVEQAADRRDVNVDHVVLTGALLDDFVLDLFPEVVVIIRLRCPDPSAVRKIAFVRRRKLTATTSRFLRL